MSLSFMVPGSSDNDETLHVKRRNEGGREAVQRFRKQSRNSSPNRVASQYQLYNQNASVRGQGG